MRGGRKIHHHSRNKRIGIVQSHAYGLHAILIHHNPPLFGRGRSAGELQHQAVGVGDSLTFGVTLALRMILIAISSPLCVTLILRISATLAAAVCAAAAAADKSTRIRRDEPHDQSCRWFICTPGVRERADHPTIHAVVTLLAVR